MNTLRRFLCFYGDAAVTRTRVLFVESLTPFLFSALTPLASLPEGHLATIMCATYHQKFR